MIDFIQITWIDIVDILMVAFILYQTYQLTKGTAAINIFVAILLLYIAYLAVHLLKMELMTKILGQFIGVGVLAIIILFQQEIRRFLLHIGTNYIKRHKYPFLKWIFYEQSSTEYVTAYNQLVDACKIMSEDKTGALIILSKELSLGIYAETGDLLDANINTRLIQNIFFKNSPLHDGAVIIHNNKIHAARCILPSSENPNIPAHMGLRHRAAIGITEATDAIALVVSEETGRISFVKSGKIEYNINTEKLKELLNGS